MTARLISQHSANFNVTFMTGFGVAGSSGFADQGVIGGSENYERARMVGESLMNARMMGGMEAAPPLPCIADGDTGYGGAASIRRTIHSYGRAGMGGVMIEDQLSPKRCGHVDGKDVVEFDEAVKRVRAACEARDEYEKMTGMPGPLILARTDARGSLAFAELGGFDEAVRRTQAFRDVGADILFLESPRSVEEMQR